MDNPHTYTLGLDYGTLSARAALVDTSNGQEVATASFDYPHGVMEQSLPGGKALPPHWALQHPQDYLDALIRVIPQVLQKAGVPASRVKGLGIDFTASSVMPVQKDGTPLCFLKEYENEPHAYVKLWKHHAAQDYATRMTQTAVDRAEPFLARYGGKISSEWLFPKLWQVLMEAPEIYAAMDLWIEAADWLTWQLTGNHTRSACCTGYKACYHKHEGYPGEDYFAALDPRLKNVVRDKLDAPVLPSGEKAGALTGRMAVLLGLEPGIAVSTPVIDAHVCVPAAGIDGPGKLLGILGTSACYMLLSNKELRVPGICGMVEDGIVPGYLGYEAGLSCMGDHFAWAVEHCVSEKDRQSAREAGLDLHAYLTREAAKLRPGQSGLLALDWWNGNRSTLVDVHLTGLMLGMTLATTSADIYRALLEATAYGTRMIMDTFRDNGIEVNEFFVTGGISRKNALAMQIYADVLEMQVQVVDASEGGALGSAIFASVAAGVHPSVREATHQMGRLCAAVYQPIPENAAVYRQLFEEYTRLYDTFGRGGNDVMKRLLRLKAASKPVND